MPVKNKKNKKHAQQNAWGPSSSIQMQVSFIVCQPTSDPIVTWNIKPEI
jgi:hypothetical protein